MEVQKYSRPKTAGDLIVTEFDQNYCRERRTLLAGSGAVRAIAMFTVLGMITLGAATSAAKAGGNTGNGTFVLDATTPVLANAQPGIYTLRCITAVTNGGTFRLEDPKGVVMGDFAIAAGAGGTVTVNDRIKGVITDGGTDFVVGDGFDVTVAIGSKKVVALDFTALNGAQYASDIAINDVTAPDGTDAPIDTLARGPVLIRSDQLVWPDGATDQQKADALALLEAKGIVARVSG